MSDSTTPPPPDVTPGPGTPGTGTPGTGTPGTGGVVVPSITLVAITEVFDKDDLGHYLSDVACARAVAGRLRVTGNVDHADANVTGSVIYEFPTSSGEFTSKYADQNNNSITDNTWECIWNDVQSGVSIRIDANPIYTGSAASALHIVPNYTGTNPCTVVPTSTTTGGVDPYLEVLFCPAVVVAGQKFWVLVRGEPVANPPDGALPIVSKAAPLVVTAGGTGAFVNGTTVFRREKIAVVEFTLPTTVRRAELRFDSVFITGLGTSILVDAIR